MKTKQKIAAVPVDPEALLDDAQTAEFLKLKSPYTLVVWRSKFPEKSPPYLKVGRHCYHRRKDLIAWLDSKLVRPPLVAE